MCGGAIFGLSDEECNDIKYNQMRMDFYRGRTIKRNAQARSRLVSYMALNDILNKYHKHRIATRLRRQEDHKEREINGIDNDMQDKIKRRELKIRVEEERYAIQLLEKDRESRHILHETFMNQKEEEREEEVQMQINIIKEKNIDRDTKRARINK